MPACPVCRDDFEDDIEVCPVDGETLVERTDLPEPTIGDATLGTFHPVVVEPLQVLLGQRQVPVRTVEVDDERVELRVPAPVRDRLRAELTLGWGSVLQAVPPDDRPALAAAGDTLPGWHDAPQGSWVDRDGRLRVDASADEQAVADASRTIGPTLALVGAVGLLLAWVTSGGELLWLSSGAAVVLGLLLPR